jgi:ketosteroid isomerase-like protein
VPDSVDTLLQITHRVKSSSRLEHNNYEKGIVALIDQLDIRLYGDTAIAVGRWRASGQHGTERFDYAARFLSIWIKQAGFWQNIGYQSTEIDS